MSSEPGGARGVLGLLVLMTLAALGVRLVGLDFAVPLLREGDSHIPMHAEMLRRGQTLQPKQNQDNVQYPRLLAGTVSLLPRASLDDPSGATLEEHLRVARRTDVQVRLLIALLAVSVLPATWLLARRSVGARWALLAAAVPATSLLHLNFSQQARPHAAFAGLFLWTVLAAVHWRERPTLGRYVLVGVLAGLTLGCLQSGVIALPVLATAWLLREREHDAGGWAGPRLMLTLGIVLVAIRVFYAFLFDADLMEARGVFSSGGDGVQLANHRLDASMFDGSGFGNVVRAIWNWDPQWFALLVLGAVGLRLGPRAASGAASRAGSRSTPELLVVLSACVPYLLVIGLYSRTFERFLLPLVPFAGLFIAAGARGLCARGAAARGVVAVVVGAALVTGLYSSTRFAWLRSQPDTLELATAWVEANVAPQGSAGTETLFASPPLDLALGRADSGLRRADGKRSTTMFSPWSKYQLRLEERERPQPLYDLRWLVVDAQTGDLGDPAVLATYLDEHGPGIYVLEVAEERAHRFLTLMAEELARRGTLEARFSPDPDPYFSNHPLLDEDEEVSNWPHVFTRVLRARAVGPVIEVYRVR